MTWIYNGTPQQDRESSWRSIVGVSISLTTAMCGVVAFRLWTRRKRLATEDYIVVVATVANIAYNALSIMQSRYGLGLPPEKRPIQDAKPVTVYNFAGRPLYTTAVCAFKIALCITYRRLIDRTTRRAMRGVVNGVIAFVVISGTMSFFLNMFGCRPWARSIDHTIPGTCLPYAPVNYFISVSLIVSDLMTFLLPIPILGPSRLPQKIKIRLVALFALGLVTTVFSVLRAYSISKNASGTGDLTDLVRYACIEANVGIITSCLNFLGHGQHAEKPNTYERRYDRAGKIYLEHGTDDNTHIEGGLELRSTSQDLILPPGTESAHHDGLRIVRKVDYEVYSGDAFYKESVGSSVRDRAVP